VCGIDAFASDFERETHCNDCRSIIELTPLGRKVDCGVLGQGLIVYANCLRIHGHAGKKHNRHKYLHRFRHALLLLADVFRPSLGWDSEEILFVLPDVARQGRAHLMRGRLLLNQNTRDGPFLEQEGLTTVSHITQSSSEQLY
jgi:hypothetical protein